MSAEPSRPVTFDQDNPEWTEEDFARARPISDFPALAAALPKARGRPKGTTQQVRKQQVTLRIDPDILERFRATGPGWQSRINDALRRAKP